MRRAAIVLAALAFLAVSALLARFLSVENAERGAAASLLRAQARGDQRAMLERLVGCRSSPPCRVEVRRNAATLRGRGALKLLALDSAPAYSLTGATGRTRVAWRLPGRLPVVQCVTVRRKGNPLSGISVSLLRLSRPIRRTGGC